MRSRKLMHTTLLPGLVPSVIIIGTGFYRPAAAAYTLRTSGLANIQYVMDASEPASTAALGAAPGIQIDSNNNVLALVDPVSGSMVTHGYGELSLVKGSTVYRNYFHGSFSTSVGSSYDGFVYPSASGNILVSPNGQAWGCMMVIRQTGSAATDLVADEGSANFDLVGLQGATDGALFISQNNGGAGAGETSSSLTALNNLQVLSFLTDGSKFYLNRNTTNTVTTPTGTIGGILSIDKFEFLNNPQADTYYVECFDGAPSVTQLNTAIHRLETRYGITDSGTLTVGPAKAIQPQMDFNNYIVNANFPNLQDPVDSSAAPSGWASSDVPNLQNFASFVFGSSNTVTTSTNCSACIIANRSQMDEHFEHNQIDGKAGVNVDGQAKDVNPSSFTAEFRSYPAGDIHDTTVVNPDGLQLKAFCSGSNGTKCQGQGNIVTGIIRAETTIKPGDLTEVCMVRPGSGSEAAWLTNWVTGGRYPAAGTTPQFYNSSIFPTRPSNYLETDDPDGYGLVDGVSAYEDLTPQTPYFDTQSTSAAADQTLQGGRIIYEANRAPITRVNGGYHTSFDQSAAAHCYQTEFVATVYTDATRTTISNPGHIVQYVDGVEYQDEQHNWDGGTELDWQGNPVPGNPVPGSALMVALQYAPLFNPTSVADMTPANVSGAIAKIYSVRMWHRTGGSHVPPTLPNAAP